MPSESRRTMSTAGGDKGEGW
eukprot:s10839_g1.t1